MSRPTHIYALHDPTDASCRMYVGKTVDLRTRLRDHCKPSTDRGIRSRWLKSLLARGVRPEMVVLEVVPACGDWQEAERFWIESLRAVGANLANHTLGGEGAPGYVHPPEVRAKMRAKAQGRGAGVPKSPEHIARIRAAHQGRAPAPGTLAAIQRIADERRGRPLPSSRGRRSEEARQHMREAKNRRAARGIER